MKFSIDKKILSIGIVTLFVVILSVSFVYALFNGNLIWRALSKIFEVITPIFYGFIMAYLMSGIVNFLEEKCILPFYKYFHVKIDKKVMTRLRFFSIILTLTIVFIFIYSFCLIVLPEIYKSLQSIIASFPSYINNLIALIEKILVRYPAIETYFNEFMNEYSSDIYEWISGVLPGMNAFIKSLSESVLGFLATIFDLILGLVVAIYMLSSKEKYVGQCKKLIYSLFNEKNANQLLRDLRFINRTFGGFINGKILDSLIIGIMCFVCLQIIGTPYPLLISVIVGVTNVIPIFGPYIGAIPSALLALMIDPMECVYFVIFILILQQFDGNYLGPKILGDSTGLSGFWVFISITIFGGLFGVAGMVIAVPTFAVGYAVIKRFCTRTLNQKGYPLDSTPYINLKEISTEKGFIIMDKTEKSYRTSKETIHFDYSKCQIQKKDINANSPQKTSTNGDV